MKGKVHKFKFDPSDAVIARSHFTARQQDK